MAAEFGGVERALAVVEHLGMGSDRLSDRVQHLAIGSGSARAAYIGKSPPDQRIAAQRARIIEMPKQVPRRCVESWDDYLKVGRHMRPYRVINRALTGH